MKKITFVFTFISFLTFAKAQDFHYGIFATPNLSSMKIGSDLYINSDIDNCSKSMFLGLSIGAFTEYSFGEHVGIQLDLAYSQYGYNLKLEQDNSFNISEDNVMSTLFSGEEKTRFSDVDMTFIFKYYLFDKRLALDLGVRPAFMTSVSRDLMSENVIKYNGTVMEQNSVDTTFNLKKGNEFNVFSLSAVGGITYYMTQGFFVEARYVFGMTDVFVKEVGRFDNNDDYVIEEINQLSKNRMLQFGIGWRF